MTFSGLDIPLDKEKTEMKKKLIVLVGVALLAAFFLTSVVSASGNVVATFTIADLGQGAWGGGSLFADGTANGHIPFSFLDGQVIFHLHPASWSWIVPGAVIEICFDTHMIKNTMGLPIPPSFCATLPVTGTPVLVDFDSDGNPDQVLRVTLAN
ncbi:MAG: hypothetical protein L0287_34160 [Anaerolineae bacterium]|nr:hypothetical protein [Anaerolineae bacterium]